MPRLEWIGKEKVVNHAKEVPFHVLERKYSFGEGRMKCIYIDIFMQKMIQFNFSRRAA